MGKQLELVLHAAHVVALVPQRFELLRHRKEARQFSFPQRVAPVLGHRRAEIGDKNRQHIIASAEPRAPRGMGEKQVNTVAVLRRDFIEINAHQMPKTVVPRHDIEIGFLDAGRFWHQRIQQATRAFADPLAADRLRCFARRQTGEHEKMPGFGRSTLQGFRYGCHHCAGRIDVPALLKPGIPGHTHFGEHRHLFAAQTRRAAASAARQTETLRIEAFTPGA